MRAAQLHTIGTILSSEAVLIANPRTKHPDLVGKIANRVKGVIAASRHVLVKYNIERARLKDATRVTPGNKAPTLSPLENEGWVAVEAMIAKDGTADILDKLEGAGARDILVLNINNCRV
jgi:ATP phosphoribosyltransferase